MLDTLDGDVRRHLGLVSRALADLRRAAASAPRRVSRLVNEGAAHAKRPTSTAS